MSTMRQEMQTRRADRQLQRALRTASPAMYNELIALSAHQGNSYNH